MSDDIAIKVEHVSKNFLLPHERVGSIKSALTSITKKRNKLKETQHALKDISFEVKKGEFFGIVGRNGSGKSTLLKILAGIYQPSKGKVSSVGKLVPFIELGVGFNPELTGRENVYLNGAMLGFSQKEVDAMYDDIVNFAELERFMDQKLKNYSSGMQVRLAFSMATRSEADILLIDEVLAVGDADFQRKCFDYFRKLKKNKKTVVFVSHDMEAVREYCDRAIFVNDSKLVTSGSPDVIAEEYIKLFNVSPEPVDSTPDQIDANRWGDGTVKYDDVTLVIDDKHITVKATLEATGKLQNPILGIQIENGLGNPVCGTNTKIIRCKVESFVSGEKREVEWKVPNIFSNGIHTVDLAVTHADGITQADWWHEATNFRIDKKHSTPHVASPEIVFSS